MSDLYEILEICLNELDKGATLESVLVRYPAQAEELRPILEASINAKNIAVPDPSADIVRRNRAKVLQHAAQMREANARSSRRLWSVPLRRVLVSLAVIGVLFVSSTRLVSAASTTLPGDNLYPVKRTWEDVLVLFTFNVQSRLTLEVEHENERLIELNEVFTQKRSVEVDFSGQVTRQNGDLWLVAGIPVAISAQTELPAQPIAVGDAIHVDGATQQDGAVLAKEIKLLPSGVPLPTINDDDSSEQEHSEESDQKVEDNSGKGSATESPSIEATQPSEPESNSGSDSSSSETEHKDVSVNGVVQSITGNIVVVNGQIMNVSSAEIKGTPKVGATVKVEGYYDSNGLFIVTKIEYENSISNDGGNSTSGSDSSDSGDNKNSGSDASGSDSSGGGGSDDGGGDISGSGGGGDG